MRASKLIIDFLHYTITYDFVPGWPKHDGPPVSGCVQLVMK